MQSLVLIYRLIVGLLALFFSPQVLSDSLPFETADALSRTVSHEQLFDGTIEAVNQTTVSSQTSGQVIRVFYDVDDFVNKGDVIVRLRDNDQRARLDQAEASLDEAQARSNEAQAEYQRIKDIFDKDLVSKSQFDKATAEREAAKARLEAARATLDQAKELFDYTKVRAPYSGIVTKRHVEIGESVQVGQPVMSGVSLEKLRVKVAVPQRLIHAVRTIGKAKVYVTSDGKSAIAAEKLIFFPYADSMTNTFEVRVELPGGVQGLFPGMFVKVDFVVGERQQLVIPKKALVYRGEVIGVYAVGAEGRVRLRHIRPGRSAGGGMIEVLAGLEEGETVVLEPIKAGAYLKARQQKGSNDG